MTLVLTFVAMLLLVAGMAVGVIFGRRPIAGSCGGMKALGLDVDCEVCGGDPNRCDSERGAPTARSTRRRTAPVQYDPSEDADTR
ncbi:MAG: (Na+)-NQR maturation NqrM [Pseudomonadales bacterium]|nr:(Na+)-NQR maturation NqrM [Pseudomonadales bacterium]